MKWMTLALAIGCAQTAFAAPVEYVLTPLLDAGALQSVQIDLRFNGDADGESLLHLPDSWGGQEKLWLDIEGLEVVSGARLSDGKDAASRRLRHAPNARVHLRYRVLQNWRQGGPSATDGNPYRPIIQPTYFHLIGNAAFAVPEIEPNTPARLAIKDLPPGWKFASDLSHPGLILADVKSSISVGGDYRILSDRESGLRVAIRGEWQFGDAEFLARVAEIAKSHRDFWGDDHAPFLVTMTYLSAPEPGWTSLGGTGLDDAFAFFATPNASVQMISRLLAHEGLHSWIPLRLGGMPEKDEAADYWLSEGFTDFYAPRLLVSEGAWDVQAFADDLNEMLRAYAISTAREYPNARVLTDFWKDPSTQKLPYQRGRLLAAIWDARLRARGDHDFDDVIHTMRKRAAAGSPLKSAALFRETAREFGLDVTDDLRQFIELGKPISLPPNVFAPCGEVATRQVPNFHRGFDIDATTAKDNVISGTDPASPAYAAGMRDGMKLVRRVGGEIGNAEIEIDYLVVDAGVERNIRYLPRAKGEYPLQALQITPDLAAGAAKECLRVLGGRRSEYASTQR